MKPTLRSLKQHQLVWAVVEEVIAQNEVIINFSGDLLRVQNHTNRTLRAGQRVQLQIEEAFPLKLKLVEQKQRSEIFPHRIDLEI